MKNTLVAAFEERETTNGSANLTRYYRQSIRVSLARITSLLGLAIIF